MGDLGKRGWVARILVIAGATGAVVACGTGSTVENDASADASDGSANEASDAPTFSDVTEQDVIQDVVGEEPPPTVRRPFLVGSAMRAAEPSPSDDWSDVLPPAHDLDEKTRAALARAWLDDALQEHASIAAFARFSMMMMSVSAPGDLVAASQRASLDEIRHARACFSLARRYGADATGPAELRVDDAMAPLTLAELAALTAEEGCVGETLGALLAEEQAARATDPIARTILKRIARDEARHAELAWRFVAWAVARGGSEVARAVRAAIRRATKATLAMEIRPLRADAAAWSAHGRLTCAESRAVAARGIAEIVEPAARALGSQNMQVSWLARCSEPSHGVRDATPR
jgi:hypothetical protein